MNEDTRNFWKGAACFAGIAAFMLMIIMAAVWGDRYFRWEHNHPAHSHEHEHEHEPHEHPHPIPDHSHPHSHDATVRRGG